jgi:hypothetical protein
MNLENLEHYAPYVLIVLLFVLQNNVFVRPEQLEKKHREILRDVKQDFVEINAYKVFQNHVLQEIASLKEDISQGFAEVKDALKRRRKDD